MYVFPVPEQLPGNSTIQPLLEAVFFFHSFFFFFFFLSYWL